MDESPIAADGLVLRKLQAADISEIAAADVDRDVPRWLPGLPDSAAGSAELTWSVLDQAAGRLVGGVALTRVDEHNGTAELSLWVAPSARRQRVASRAGAAVAQWAFDSGYGRVEACTDRFDEAGQRAVIAAGFTYEATKVSAMRSLDGDRGDLFVWRRLPADRPGPSVRLLPDPPAEGLTDGVVTIRPQLEADAQVLVECWRDPLTRRWLNQPSEQTVERARQEIRRAPGDLLTGRAAHFSVVETATGSACGDCTVGMALPDMGIAALGYMIHPAFRGRGYAARAARLAADWAMTVPAIGRLEVSAAVANDASLAVIAKAGFEFEGVIRGFLPNPDGQRLDSKQSARVRD